jgi:predicted RNA-binding protein YlqC (UPF0109 family)
VRLIVCRRAEHLVRGVVTPGRRRFATRTRGCGSLLEVRVHLDDLGMVIGRNGRTATAFRTVIGPVAARARIDFVDVDWVSGRVSIRPARPRDRHPGRICRRPTRPILHRLTAWTADQSTSSWDVGKPTASVAR